MDFKIDNRLGDVFYNEPMKNHTSFKVGGNADILVMPKDEDSLIEIIKLLKEKDIKYYVLGNSTNVIVKDNGFDGVIIKLKDRLNDLSVDGNIIYAGAGASMKDLSEFACDNSLEGLEFAHGIPGSVGGAIVMNAGAYDGETKFVVSKVRLLNSDLEIIEKPVEEMNFGYRHSLVQEEDLIVLGAYYKLKPGDKKIIKAKYEEFDKRRADKQPLELPSAGSTFKRPEGYFAGKLIDDSGLRGFTHKGAGISEKHCGFVVNKDNASASDILETIEIVQKVVKDNFGVELKREVKIIGE